MNVPQSLRPLALLAALLLPPLAAHAADFETGVVQPSDAAGLWMNSIPQVARLANGDLLAVWTANSKGDPVNHIHGSISSDGGRTWAPNRVLFQDAAKADDDPNILVNGRRVMVFTTRVTVPNRIEKSWILMTGSDDFGRTWSDPAEVAIPRQYVVGKQADGIRLRDGTLMMGIAWDKWPEMGMAAKTEGEMDLTTGVLLSKDGLHWTLHGAIHASIADKVLPYSTGGLCEPSLVELANGQVLMLLRSGSTHHYESRSDDGGVTWSAPAPSSLPGDNTPSALWRLDQNPKEIVVVWNNCPMARYPLSVALSGDGGVTWSNPRALAETDGLQVSYPGITQAADGPLVAVWQQQIAAGGREIRWARFTRDWIVNGGGK